MFRGKRFAHKHTRMLISELGDIVDIAINDNPERVWLVVRRDVGLGEGLGHGGGWMNGV